jgi:hypothetical protein
MDASVRERNFVRAGLMLRPTFGQEWDAVLPNHLR